MEVWLLQEYIPDEGVLETLKVYDNPEAAMYAINLVYDGIIWRKYGPDSLNDHYWNTNTVDGREFYLQKFEVILDEVPNN